MRRQSRRFFVLTVAACLRTRGWPSRGGLALFSRVFFCVAVQAKLKELRAKYDKTEDDLKVRE